MTPPRSVSDRLRRPPLEDYGIRRHVEFTPSPDQQLELRRFNFRLRRA